MMLRDVNDGENGKGAEWIIVCHDLRNESCNHRKEQGLCSEAGQRTKDKGQLY
jgi:hypothetical protein